MKNKKIKYIIPVLLKLIKYKLSLAITLSSGVGYLMLTREVNLPFIILLAGVFILSGGSAALNQYHERHYDAIMRRTINRPLPQRKINQDNALHTSLLLILIGLSLLLIIDTLPAILGLTNIILYNLVYTRLKRITAIAVFPGAVVGAIPPLIGWTAAGGYIFHSSIIYISLLIFLWQIPHFWLLMIKYGKEYEQAGYSTILKIMSPGQIKSMVFIWMTFTSGIVLCFPLFNIYLPPIFTFILITLNILFIGSFYSILFRKSKIANVRSAFMLINAFLMAIFLIFIVNSVI